MPSDPDRPLLEAVRRRLGESVDAVAVAREVRRMSAVTGTGHLLQSAEWVIDEVVGAGPLQQFLYDADVSDVVVNGPGPVWVDKGAGLVQTDATIDDEQSLRRLAQRLVSSCGRRLDDAMPFADARLVDGTRLHAVLPPLSPSGTLLSLRLPPRRTFSLDDLVRVQSLPAEGAELLRALVDARLAFVVTGGTGTGKTTVLSTLLSLVAPHERMVLVEDAVELRPHHPHVVRLESRLPNAEGAGGVDLAVLVRQALRMRPDRLVVGEVRGGECVDLLAALNVGHDGGAGTLHANSPADVPARVEALCTAGGLSREAAHSQLAAGLRLVIHLRRAAGGARRLDSVGVVCRGADGFVEVASAVRVRGGEMVDGPARRELDRMLDRDVSSEAS
jgi:pilus assembly protein CpaF